jgi:hypothetical protein
MYFMFFKQILKISLGTKTASGKAAVATGPPPTIPSFYRTSHRFLAFPIPFPHQKIAFAWLLVLASLTIAPPQSA